MWAVLVVACAGVERPTVWEDCEPLAATGAAQLEAGELAAAAEVFKVGANLCGRDGRF